MGGLWKKLPIPFWSMAIGSAALVALPFTSGFASKDAILLTAYDNGGWLYWAGGALAAGMTALYTTRMMIVTFFGETKTEPHDDSKANMWLPLVVLAALSIGGGWFGIAVLNDLLGPVGTFDHFTPLALTTIAVPLLGVFIGWLVFTGRMRVDGLVESGLGRGLRRFWHGGWGFDWVYDRVFVKPFVAVARINKNDVVDLVFRVTAAVARGLHYIGALTQTGRLRWYARQHGYWARLGVPDRAGGPLILGVILLLLAAGVLALGERAVRGCQCAARRQRGGVRRWARLGGSASGLAGRTRAASSPRRTWPGFRASGSALRCLWTA